MVHMKDQSAFRFITILLFFFASVGTFVPLSSVWAQNSYWSQSYGNCSGPSDVGAKDIAAGGDRVWITTAARAIKQMTITDPPGSWGEVYGAGNRITVKSNGLPLVTNEATQQIYEWRGSISPTGAILGHFDLLEKKATTDIAIGGGKIWILGAQNTAQYGYNVSYQIPPDTAWIPIPGAATQIAATKNGNAWVVNGQNDVYYSCGGSAFTSFGTRKAKNIAAGGVKQEQVFLVSTNQDSIFQYSADPCHVWQPVPAPPETPVTAIAVDSDGKPWIISGPNHNIYRGGQ